MDVTFNIEYDQMRDTLEAVLLRSMIDVSKESICVFPLG